MKSFRLSQRGKAMWCVEYKETYWFWFILRTRWKSVTTYAGSDSAFYYQSPSAAIDGALREIKFSIIRKFKSIT
jgi:hypothetical protein